MRNNHSPFNRALPIAVEILPDGPSLHVVMIVKFPEVDGGGEQYKEQDDKEDEDDDYADEASDAGTTVIQSIETPVFIHLHKNNQSD
jgi:hypothetical protein